MTNALVRVVRGPRKGLLGAVIRTSQDGRFLFIDTGTDCVWVRAVDIVFTDSSEIQRSTIVMARMQRRMQARGRAA